MFSSYKNLLQKWSFWGYSLVVLYFLSGGVNFERYAGLFLYAVAALFIVLWLLDLLGKIPIRFAGRTIIYFACFGLTMGFVRTALRVLGLQGGADESKQLEIVGVIAGALWVAGYALKGAVREARERSARAARERQRAGERIIQAAEAAQRAAEESRRVDARAKVEMFYALHAPELTGRFGRDRFEEFVNRYLIGSKPAVDVERRAA